MTDCPLCDDGWPKVLSGSVYYHCLPEPMGNWKCEAQEEKPMTDTLQERLRQHDQPQGKYPASSDGVPLVREAADALDRKDAVIRAQHEAIEHSISIGRRIARGEQVSKEEIRMAVEQQDAALTRAKEELDGS